MSCSLKVYFSLFYYNLKGKDQNRRKTSTKKNIYMWNQYYYHYFDVPKIRFSWAHTIEN